MNDLFDWQSIRRDFPITERVAYLNSAAAGPLPRTVAEAATMFYRQMMEEGDARWEAWLERREMVRRCIAELINAEPDEIAFTINTSSGMNLIADALEDRGEVISCALEFPVSTVTWIHRGVRVHLIEPRGGEVSAEDIRRAMNERTGVISLSHVQYSNGFRADLEAVGEDKGRHLLVVNASQSAGAFRIDVKRMKIDALCSTGHKWMLAGYGAGFVYLSRELLAETRARAIGWMSMREPFEMSNRDASGLRVDAAARAELGCPHFAGIFALGAAVEYQLKLGTSQIEQRALTLNRRLTSRLIEEGWKVLSPLRDERQRSAETLVATENPARTVSELAARGVAVTEKPQGIRVATHFFNNEEDIERLIVAMRETK
jgi:cysteine desulfurase/selenocysteine lyase